MLYGNIINENAIDICEAYELDMFDIITENMQTCMEFALSELGFIDEVYISPDQRKSKTYQKSIFESVKEYAIKLWNSFKEWCKVLGKKIKEKINKVKEKIFKTKQSNSSEKNDKKDAQSSSSKTMVNFYELNSDFDKVNEKNLMNDEVLNLSALLQNYRKDLFENYNNADYTKEVTKDVTGGLVDSIDDLKPDMLIDKKEVELTDDIKNKAKDISGLNNLAKMYDDMISLVDNYFNRLQDSIRKAEAKYKDMGTTDYTDSNISAKVNNPLQYMQMKKILATYVKMIGVQSGIVRNIVYVKVAAISYVLDNRASLI